MSFYQKRKIVMRVKCSLSVNLLNHNQNSKLLNILKYDNFYFKKLKSNIIVDYSFVTNKM